ncbi:hypothetical protein [Microbacterium sp.]|uniref:hypothetical protein n=1 Tax=Microbacterium sp. TaxID=51671 RepID=UPI003C75FC01
MSEPSSVPDIVALEKRILELEAENVRLAEEKGDPEPQTPASAPRPAGSRWRSFVSAFQGRCAALRGGGKIGVVASCWLGLVGWMLGVLVADNVGSVLVR